MLTSRLLDLCRTIAKPSTSTFVIEELKEIFKKHESHPKPINAFLTPISLSSKSYKLQIDWSHIDFDSIDTVKFYSEYLVNLNVDGAVDGITELNSFQDVSDISCSISSYSNKWKAIVRDITRDGKKSQVIEFWSSKGKIKTINGEKDKSFGKVLLSFGPVTWSRDESQLLFIADKNEITSGFFGDKKKDDEKNGESKNGDDKVKPAGQGDEYLLKEDWGEQLEGTYQPVVCIIDLKDDYKVRIIEVPGFSSSEAFWIDEKSIGFVGIKEDHRRLGLIFCPIRQSYLYSCDLRDPESEPDIIYGGDVNVAIRSPRVSYDSKKVVFLSNPPSGPHFQASSLIVLNLEDLKSKVLINNDNVTPNEIDNPTEIKSLYCGSLPDPCWTSDNKKIIVVCDVGYKSHLFLVDSETGEKIRVPVSVPGEVVSVLALRDDLIVMKISQPNFGNNLQLGKLVNNQVNLVSIDPNLTIKVDGLDYRCDIIEKIDNRMSANDGKQIITSILLSPKELNDQPSPTILMLHGGPHSAYPASYFKHIAMMVQVGFKVICVNYRGSSDISPAQEKFLCGKVGEVDVQDCMDVLKYYINEKKVDSNQVFLYGGSHGGFLVTHLIGQHADFGFRASAAINPVTDLAAQFSTTDIPDWALVEGTGLLDPYPLTTIPSPELLSQLLEKSPIAHVDKVKTPVLMALGTKDKRVAMCQGLNYHYALKARGVKSKCLVYEDNHSIGKIPHDLDLYMNVILWFLDHLKSDSQ